MLYSVATDKNEGGTIMQVDSAKFKRLCYASILDYLKAKNIPFESTAKKATTI